MAEPRRDSDRYVTPRVIVAGLFLATVVVLAVVASVTYLTARGLDPDPMLRLTAQVGGAVFSAGTFALQLVGRRTVTKVERAVGQLTPAVDDALYALEEERGRHASQAAREAPRRTPVPDYPATVRHPLYGAPGYPGQGTAPAAERS